jgi:hypothetical protein
MMSGLLFHNRGNRRKAEKMPRRELNRENRADRPKARKHRAEDGGVHQPVTHPKNASWEANREAGAFEFI